MSKQTPKKKPFLLSSALLVVVLAAGIWSVFSLARYELERDLNNWQLTLSVMADNRSANLTHWTDDRFSVLRELAANGSLQLYTQQLVDRPPQKQETEAVQLSYLRNLIITTAQRSGFYDESKSTSTVRANFAFHADNGLALISSNKTIITSTPGLTSLDATLNRAVDTVFSTGKHLFSGINLNENNQPVAGYLVPVFALQKQINSQKPIAVIYGFNDASLSFYHFLDRKNLVTKTSETILVRQEGNLISYLSPLADGTPPLTRSVSADTDQLVASFALLHPGKFSQGIDYGGRKTLFTSRLLPGLNMTLIQKISLDEALSESKQHQQFLLTTLLMALLLSAVLIIAAWWYGSSIKSQKAAAELVQKTRELESQSNLLNAINNNMTDNILLVDYQSQLIFANKSLYDLLGMTDGELKGRSLRNIFGPDAAKKFYEALNLCSIKKPVSSEISLYIDGMTHLFFSTSLQVEYAFKDHASFLITLSDVTQLEEARSKKDRLMKQIVSSLMHAIDLHDPYSANHSAKTCQISVAVAKAMGLSTSQLTTIEIASSLCNLGKLSIPKEILLKPEKLSKDEQQILRKETDFASEILFEIEFEGPVLETICQKHECIDGSGYPKKLKGDAILLTARILAAANSFVAMTSPRSYRDRLSDREAIDQLLSLSGNKYDRQVVAALFHVIENEQEFLETTTQK
ncbi:MAG: PAS domain S-box protein [Desulfobulbaceae bacterium]|nr:PAS domain S-box protein [Desulfobulbaceae bacterium]